MNNEDVERLEAFIQRWQGREGGQERANYALFLTEFCNALDLNPPDPAGAKPETNDYVFERVVKESTRDGLSSNKRIDLYYRDRFVLEAKQSRQEGGAKAIAGQSDFLIADDRTRGRRGAGRSWDVLMMNARQQAEDYVRLLPEDHLPPPFIIVCDVGHCFEIYSNFRKDGKAYDQFPDRRSFRVYLEDLRNADVRNRLIAIWKDPDSLNPARTASRVTRDIARRLAAVSKSLEAAKHPPEEVAMFLMRCLFTMFAEDVGLLPRESFKKVLQRCEVDPSKLAPMVGQLWEAMDQGGFAIAIEEQVRRFNGEFFKSRAVLPLAREEIGELRQAATHTWRDVDPSIFGTLLEQALNPDERWRLGAHYTPRAYVERLVVATVIEPLRADWISVLSTAERLKAEDKRNEAISTVRVFHQQLCATRVLDPACGTGNFLYVALELMKRLEGEVLEALVDLGGEEAMTGLEGHTVDPHQFLGLEKNTRAAAIAELVLWIGHLQWHIRTKGGLPSEPILRAFKNIVAKDAVLAADVDLARDDRGKPLSRLSPDGYRTEIYAYKHPQRPTWPAAEFIVGNPPFIGKGEHMRRALSIEYVEALRAAHPSVNDSADFVMYWWDRAAELLTRKGSVLRRFGFVTTNSITQVLNRKVLEKHLNSKRPISLAFAIPDHPWYRSGESAAVRIAMTVCVAGRVVGTLQQVAEESELNSDSPRIVLQTKFGEIHSDLTVGVDVTRAVPLRANAALASMGPALGGRGFVVSSSLAQHLSSNGDHVKKLTTGLDITGRHRGRYVIDVRKFESEEALRKEEPKIYQHLLETVFPVRRNNADPKLRKYWWRFRRSNETYFNAVAGLKRFIATVETTKHRTFVFVDGRELLEHGVVGIGLGDAWALGVLSSRIHVCWALANGGTLEDRPRYNKDVCFDPFPFPILSPEQKKLIGQFANELNEHRHRALAASGTLTLTEIYNVLEALRSGTRPEELSQDDRYVYDTALVLLLKKIHDDLDAAVAAAYGWSADISDEDILSKLVALNLARASEEKSGRVHWLRAAYQAQLVGSDAQRRELSLVGAAAGQADAVAGKPVFPSDNVAQTAAVMALLGKSSEPMDPSSVAAQFKQGRRVEPRIASTLAALVRMGFVSSADGVRGFTLRRS
jgi:SAM-dependent methyltransferase